MKNQELKELFSDFFSITGVISKRDFHKAMESHKHYTQSETEFLLSCAETDENEQLDYEEFVERFHEPAKVNGQRLNVHPGSAPVHLSSQKVLRQMLTKNVFCGVSIRCRILKDDL